MVQVLKHIFWPNLTVLEVILQNDYANWPQVNPCMTFDLSNGLLNKQLVPVVLNHYFGSKLTIG